MNVYDQLDSFNSRETIKACEKLLRRSRRNKKIIRKTTLIQEIQQLLETGVELDEDDRKKFRKFSFPNDKNATLQLKPRSKRLKKHKSDQISKKILLDIKSIPSSHHECEDEIMPPPPPPSGSPEKSCQQPKLKELHNSSHFYRFAVDISEMLESMHFNSSTVKNEID